MGSDFLPLDDVLVVSLEQAAAGPLCTRVLGEFGARVVRVERPGGEMSRRATVFGEWSATDLWVNSSKESLALDIKQPRACDVLWRLAERADVLVENLRPGVVAALGLTAEALRERNPRLVFCQVSGFGQDGPYAGKPAYDITIQGEAGLIGLTGTPETPTKVGVAVSDSAAGVYAALATVMALIQARKTGKGTHIDFSMLDASAWFLATSPFQYWYGGQVATRDGARHSFISPYGIYDTADGKIVIAPISDEMWARLCHIIGRDELAGDPRFATRHARFENRLAVDAVVEESLSQRPSSEWIQLFDAANLPCGLVRELGDVLEHPQLKHRGLIGEFESGYGPVKLFNWPARFDGRYRQPRKLPPAIGQHSEAILRELGYSETEIEVMRQEGLIE